jgi:hypothetical protein
VTQLRVICAKSRRVRDADALTTWSHPNSSEPVAKVYKILLKLAITNLVTSSLVGPCHHDMARPQVADGGTASSSEGSCKYIE